MYKKIFFLILEVRFKNNTMKKIAILIISSFTLWSCGASQPMRVVYERDTYEMPSYPYYETEEERVNRSPKKTKSNKSYHKTNSKQASVSNPKPSPTPAPASHTKSNGGKVASILSDAEKYLGTPYRLGGMTSSGFDCSGFVNKVFDENDIKLTRRSADQAKEGVGIDVTEVRKGDLLFFATAGGKRVSHVGIVHTIGNDGEIKFIHASTTKGVIISSLDETYWDKAFLFARRVL